MRDLNALKRQPRQGVETSPTAGDVPPNPAPASGINPLTPQPLDPSQNVTAKTPRAASAGRSKKPHPLLSPPVLVTAALTVVLLELALWVTVGPLWWVAVNLLLVLVLLGSLRWVLSWWRKQLAATPTVAGRATPIRGPLGRLTGSKAGGSSGSRSGGLLGRGRSGSGGGRLGRLFGGSGKSGGSGRSGGAAGSGRRGGLGRLLSGGRRTGSGPAGRSGTGRSGTGSGRSGAGRSGLRGLLAGSGRRSSAGRTGGGLRGLLGGRKSAGGASGSGGTAGRTGTAGGSRRGGAVSRMRSAGRGLLGRASGRPSSTKRATPTGSPRRTNAARKGSAGLAGFFKGVREGAAGTGRKPGPRPAAETAKPEPAKPQPVPAQKSAPRNDAERKPSPHPRATPKENRPMIQHRDDPSLQRWGRNLTTVGPALEEFAKATDGHAEFAGSLATAVSRLASQGDDELPAAKSVTAEAAAIAAELKQVEAEAAAAAGKLRSLAGRADALGASYRRNHETDEARLAGERGGRHKEKRADVGHAEQDT